MDDDPRGWTPGSSEPTPLPRRGAAAGGRRGSSLAGTVRRRVVPATVVLVIVVGILARFWVDLLWFSDLGQRDVLVTRLRWSTSIGLAFGLLTFAVLYANFRVVQRIARNDLFVPFLVPQADPEAPEQPVVPHFVLRPLLFGVAVVGGILGGLAMGGRWETVLRFLGRSDFGVQDPQFGKDAAFYVFTLPVFEMFVHFAQVLIVATGIVVVVAYVATGVIRYVPALRVARSAIVHLAWLVAAFLVISAFATRLSIWNLATSNRGVVAGAGWTDVHARIPAYWLMTVASLVLAGVIVWFARKERWRVVGGAVVGWVALSVIATGIVPALVQNVLVEPNELDREQEVLAGNIANTRAAWDLEKITTAPFRDEAKLSEEQLLRGNTGTTDNIRLWSPDVLVTVIDQLESLLPFYEFRNVDVDRYTIDGRYRQVTLAVRELKSDATGVAQSWTNQRLRYTHGYGVVATLPNEATSQGRPRFLLQNIPPKGPGTDDLPLDRPEIYFGEQEDNLVFVGTRQDEVSGGDGTGGRVTPGAGEETASDATTSTTRYEGDGGIRVSSFARRAAFAATFGDARILFTSQITSKSRVMFRRNVSERIAKLAPFLELDGDPYAVVQGGRVVWVVDAYTTSDRFPYAEGVQRGVGVGATSVNYLRNSVKAVVDAYDGDVTLYVQDAKDPILRSWREIFPDLFTPMEEMPAELRAHLRYPEDLFQQQTALWTRYHMTDTEKFYSRTNQWEVPQLRGQEMEAFYVLAKLPGATKEELLLVRPLTPRGKKNMVAYMAARSDGEQYGEVVTLELPTQELTQGPAQVQARINGDDEVSDQVRQWTTGNNEVIFGSLLVLPVEKSLLYVQPVYLQNAEAAIPEFQRVVVVLGEDVAWGDTFAEAVRSLLAERGAAVSDAQDELEDAAGGDEGDDGAGGEDAGDGDDAGAPAIDTDDFDGLTQDQLVRLLSSVSSAYDRAEACQRRGDGVCAARELETVERLLDEARSGAAASGTQDGAAPADA